MTNEEFEQSDYEIESYGNGFRIADYSEKVPTPYGARYRGKNGIWKSQPNISLDSVFETEAEAIADIASGKVFIDQKETDSLMDDLL